MDPTPQETTWALAVKRAAQRDPKVRHLDMTDLEFLQHAIVAKGQPKKALKRIKRLQKFKERYGILCDGSWEQAQRAFTTSCHSFPYCYLGLGVAPNGASVVSIDVSAYHRKLLTSEEAFRVLMRAHFYMFQATQPDLAAMRAGVQCLCDFQHVGLENFSMEAERRAAELYANSYPMRVKGITMAGTMLFVRFFFELIKPFFSKKVTQTYQFPKTMSTYLGYHNNITAPNLPVAWGGDIQVKQVEQIFEARLKRRYELARTFRLSSMKSQVGEFLAENSMNFSVDS